MNSNLVDVLERYGERAGAIGVALGAKEVGGEQAPDAVLAVAFFVGRKEPRNGGRTRLPSGRYILPRSLEVGGRRLATDVVEAESGAVPRAAARVQRAKFTAGGPVGNRMEIGTFGCIVSRRGSPYPYALTNHHVGLAPNSVVAFPSYGATGAIPAVTRASVQLVPDEKFFPAVDRPRSYFDVDAALVQIPSPSRSRFTARIPTIGIPDRIFQPDMASVDAYTASVVGKPVVSWCWNTRRRSGVISHVFFVTALARFAGMAVYSFLIRSADGAMPSQKRDSGKVWVAPRPGGGVDLVGLHQGSVNPSGSSTRFAVATEVAALARLLRISPRTAM